MFYCTDILRKNDGKFGAIWLAAFYGKDLKKILSRREIIRVDITQACTDVVHPTVRFSLRLQSNLMVGILRVYKEQVSHFCNEIKHAWRDLRMTFHVDMRLIDLHRPMLSEDACTIPDPVNEQILGHFDDFPKDIFSMSPTELFPTDNSDEFIHIGFQSPTPSLASSPTHIPPGPAHPTPPGSVHPTPPGSVHPTPPGPAQVSPGLHQARKDQITLSEKDLPEHRDETIQIPGDDIIPPVAPDDPDEITDQDERRLSPLPDHDILPGHYDVKVIDPVTGELRTKDTGSKSKEEDRPFEDDMVTPSARIELVSPDRPHKRKRQPVDKNRKLSDEKIKRNHLTVRDTLRDQIIDLPLRLSAQELLNNPCRQELRSLPFIDCWRENAVTPRIADEDIPPIFDYELSDPERTPEAPRDMRGQVDSSYERSGTIGSFNITPSSPTPGHDRTRPTFDMSRPGSDIDIPGTFPDMPTIPKVVVEKSKPAISPIEEISEILEDFDAPEEDPFEHVLRRSLEEAISDEEPTSFAKILPPRDTNKGDAAKGFFQLLEWHRQGVVVLSQPGAGFSEIYIERGGNYSSMHP